MTRPLADARTDRRLAINGGPAAITSDIAADAPPWAETAAAEMSDLLRRDATFGWYGGPRQRAFEEAFSHWVGAEHGVLCSSGTTALTLALHLLGAGDGRPVAIPSFSFYSVLTAALHLRTRPFLLATDPATLVLDVDRAIDEMPQSCVLVAVHTIGRAVDVRRILEARPDVTVLEDACDAQTTSLRGAPVGLDGVATCWSFTTAHNEVHVAATAGMLTTSDEQIAARFRQLCHYGKPSRRVSPEVGLNPAPTEAGFNGMSSELEAVVGLATLQEADQAWRRRRTRGRDLEAGLRSLGLHTTAAPPGCDQNYYDVVAGLPDDWAVERAWVFDALLAEGVPAWTYHSLLALPWTRKSLGDLGCWGAREEALAAAEPPLVQRLIAVRPQASEAATAQVLAAVAKVVAP